jgi:hypothetical protein
MKQERAHEEYPALLYLTENLLCLRFQFLNPFGFQPAVSMATR